MNLTARYCLLHKTQKQEETALQYRLSSLSSVHSIAVTYVEMSPGAKVPPRGQWVSGGWEETLMGRESNKPHKKHPATEP